MTQPPEDARTAGYQEWRTLTFLHWRIPADRLQPLIPSSLTIQEFDGSAWLGVVPFAMAKIRPWWSPPVPGISWFLETNVRTYVVDRNGVSGVWFFSLDANQWLAVNIARTFWHLPYKLATLAMSTQAEQPQASNSAQHIVYQGHRLDSPSADYQISVDVSKDPPQEAAPGTLDHFLVERYFLFAAKQDGSLMTGQVHHKPYQLRRIVQLDCSETLTRAMGCECAATAPDHAAFSDGVKVRVSPLQ
ncbi:MAG: YqjF family protein [Planctomycetota bacterium]